VFQPLRGQLALDHRLCDLALCVVVELIENHRGGNAREDLGSELTLSILSDEPLHRLKFGFSHGHDALRTDVAREDHIPRREIQDTILTRGESRGIQQLKQDIKDLSVRLLDFGAPKFRYLFL
jgi:hypothetical protein